LLEKLHENLNTMEEEIKEGKDIMK